ncbi:MAG: winged helix-turn-helix transcriptional regulator [Myxococcales bacterium]|nr:winged helix-turn-helix transcriptional regulator [Myxococcales bacterium]
MSIDGEHAPGGWTFLSNHAHVLICLARDPDARLRDIAERVGITERAVHRIVSELEDGGVITRTRTGRRNHYEIDPNASMRHPLESTRTVGSLLLGLLDPAEARRLGLRAGRAKA